MMVMVMVTTAVTRNDERDDLVQVDRVDRNTGSLKNMGGWAGRSERGILRESRRER